MIPVNSEKMVGKLEKGKNTLKTGVSHTKLLSTRKRTTNNKWVK